MPTTSPLSALFEITGDDGFRTEHADPVFRGHWVGNMSVIVLIKVVHGIVAGTLRSREKAERSSQNSSSVGIISMIAGSIGPE